MSKRILFLCTGNSCRSQIAEGLWCELAGPDGEAYSAGFVHPLAVEIMAERGIDLDDARSKSIDGFLGMPMDLVVTACDDAREVCPALPGARRTLHWPFDDPALALGSPDASGATIARAVEVAELHV
jgi:arsenate reductase